jgi:hypothetical protein
MTSGVNPGVGDRDPRFWEGKEGERKERRRGGTGTQDPQFSNQIDATGYD